MTEHDVYEIVGCWFGWYWNHIDLAKLADVIEKGSEQVELTNADKSRMDSVIKHIRNIVDQNSNAYPESFSQLESDFHESLKGD